MTSMLHPETRKLLAGQHEHLAETRRLLRTALEATDRHIEIILRILNDRGDQRGLDQATRKFVRATRALGENVDAYVKAYVVVGKPSPAAPPEPEKAS